MEGRGAGDYPLARMEGRVSPGGMAKELGCRNRAVGDRRGSGLPRWPLGGACGILRWVFLAPPQAAAHGAHLVSQGRPLNLSCPSGDPEGLGPAVSQLCGLWVTSLDLVRVRLLGPALGAGPGRGPHRLGSRWQGRRKAATGRWRCWAPLGSGGASWGSLGRGSGLGLCASPTPAGTGEPAYWCD